MPAFKCMPYGDSLIATVDIVYFKMVCLHDMIVFALHIDSHRAFVTSFHTPLWTHENVGITSSDDGGQ